MNPSKPNLPIPQGSQDSAPVTREKVLEFLQTFGLMQQLRPMETEQFIQLAREFQLNPFKRELHCVPFGEGEFRRLSIIVGYEVYIKRAERGGRLDGWKAWIEGQGDAMKAVVEIYRKDWAKPFIHEVYWSEVVQKKRDGTVTPFWQKMPRFQLKKVAISQGFRLCFPDELGGLPYEGAELSIDPPEIMEIPAQTVIPSTTAKHSGHVDQDCQSSVTELPPPAEHHGTLFAQLDSYLEDHISHFTPQHIAWIKEKVATSPTAAKIEQMLAYARRIVEEDATDPPNSAQAPAVRKWSRTENRIKSNPSHNHERSPL